MFGVKGVSVFGVKVGRKTMRISVKALFCCWFCAGLGLADVHASVSLGFRVNRWRQSAGGISVILS